MYVSELRGRRVSGQKRGGLILCFLDADAAAVAGFVAAGEEDLPIFWTLGGVRGGGGENGLLIGGGEGHDVVCGGFCCGRCDRGGGCGGDVGFCFFDP